MNKKVSLQRGRSMIEMLGVLAIIGVLSVGGIAGYSKAMKKYRVNKLANQITQLAQNIRTLYGSQKTYSSLTSNVILRAHLAPEEMYESTGSSSLTHPFGGHVSARPSSRTYSGDNKAFSINVWVSFDEEACIDLLTRDWGASGIIGIGRYAQGDNKMMGCTTSNTSWHCAEAGVMPVDIAMAICNSSMSNDIDWKFY